MSAKGLYSAEELQLVLSRTFNKLRQFDCPTRRAPLPIRIERVNFRQGNWTIPRCGRCSDARCDRLLSWIEHQYGGLYDLRPD